MTTYTFNPTDSISSIQTTINGAAAGSEFVFNHGIYYGLSCTPKADQIFRSADGAKATLSGGLILDPARFALYDSGSATYWRMDYNERVVVNDATVGSYTIGNETGYERAGMNIAVFLYDANGTPTQYRNMNTLASLDSTPNAFFIEAGASPQYLYIKQNPNELTANGSTLLVNNTPYWAEFSVANITLQNMVFEHYASRVQRSPIYVSNQTTGSGLYMFNVTSRRNNGVGVRFGDDAELVCCRLLENGQAGYSFKGDNIQMIGCLIADNNVVVHTNRGFEAGGGKGSGGTSVSCNNPLIVGCMYSGNYGKSCWFDIEVEFARVLNCFFKDGYDAAIFYETCFDAVIANNVIINCCNSGAHTNQPWDAALAIVNSQARINPYLQVYGNVVVCANLANCGAGIGVVQADRGTSTIYGAGLRLNSVNVRVFNNFVYHPAGTGRNGLAANYDATVFYNSNNNFFYGNGYYTLAATNLIFQYNGSNLAFATGSTPTWQTVTSPDLSSKAQDTTASGGSITASVAGAPDGSTWQVRNDLSYMDTIRTLPQLASYFPMNAASGTVVYDRSPHGADRAGDGAYQGSFTLGQAGIGDGETAVRLTRSGDGRTNTYTSQFNTKFSRTKFTWGGWFKMSSGANWTDGLTHGILRIGGATGAGNFELHYRKNTTNGEVVFFFQDGTGTSCSITVSSMSSTDWIFVALSYDLADPLATAYHNGASVGTDTTIASTGGTNLNTTFGHGRSTGLTGNNLDGWLAHWFICNEQLTTPEVASLYNYKRSPVVTVTTSDLVATGGEAFDEQIVTAATDDSGGAITYTFSGLPDWLTYNSSTGHLTGTPTNDDAGEWFFALTATDPDGLDTSVPFSIQVYEGESGTGGEALFGGIGNLSIRTRVRTRGGWWRS